MLWDGHSREDPGGEGQQRHSDRRERDMSVYIAGPDGGSEQDHGAKVTSRGSETNVLWRSTRREEPKLGAVVRDERVQRSKRDEKRRARGVARRIRSRDPCWGRQRRHRRAFSFRVLAHPNAREVPVSAVVPLLVEGSCFEFDDRGEHELKGTPGTWRLFAVRD